MYVQQEYCIGRLNQEFYYPDTPCNPLIQANSSSTSRNSFFERRMNSGMTRSLDSFGSWILRSGFMIPNRWITNSKADRNPDFVLSVHYTRRALVDSHTLTSLWLTVQYMNNSIARTSRAVAMVDFLTQTYTFTKNTVHKTWHLNRVALWQVIQKLDKLFTGYQAIQIDISHNCCQK